jgi:hypothetical protein
MGGGGDDDSGGRPSSRASRQARQQEVSAIQRAMAKAASGFIYKFFDSVKAGIIAMWKYSQETGNEVAGVDATREKDGAYGIIVQYDENNTKDHSAFNYRPAIWIDDERYILGKQHYHTHPGLYSLETPSQRDIDLQKKWPTPLNIIHYNRIYKFTGSSYERTNIKY